MPPVPRLTIGIPTYDRPQMIGRAIASALAQQRPARVLIGDQTGAAYEAVKPWLSNPLVGYVRTGAGSLWENWTLTAEHCQTEFFAWLQDDDEVYPHFAQRVEMSFDAFPSARVYMGRVAIELAGGLANWWQCCGPMLPMDLRRGLPSLASGLVVTAAGYFTSFALSPAVAFRWSADACAAVRRCPMSGCDLYNERIVLAELAEGGDVVSDPALVGSWVQHDGNESKSQVSGGGRRGQFPLLVERLDARLAGRDGWEAALASWLTFMKLSPGILDHWLAESADYESDSPTYARALSLLRQARGEVVSLEPERPAPAAERAVSRKARRSEKAVRAR